MRKKPTRDTSRVEKRSRHKGHSGILLQWSGARRERVNVISLQTHHGVRRIRRHSDDSVPTIDCTEGVWVRPLRPLVRRAGDVHRACCSQRVAMDVQTTHGAHGPVLHVELRDLLAQLRSGGGLVPVWVLRGREEQSACIEVHARHVQRRYRRVHAFV